MRNTSEIRWAWGLIAVLAVADMLGLALTGMDVRIVSCLPVAAMTAILLLISFIYSTIRQETRLVYFAVTVAQLLLYTALAGVLSYLLTAGNRPAIDAGLVAADRFLGFDWTTMYAWGKTHVAQHFVLICAYKSLLPQLTMMYVVLFTKGLFDRARELFWLFILTSLGCVVVSGLFPAAGAFGTFNVQTADPSLQHFLALRDGRMKSIDLLYLQGLVSFPSFHLALAVILAYAARGIPVLFPFFLALNTLVIAATPLVGGHHFADLWGGALLTLGAIALMRRFSSSFLQNSDS
ncbi:MAG: phosphatase PAP2 family protein [Chlorobiaceae bacterium]